MSTSLKGKAQIAIEFIMIVGIGIGVIIVFLIIAINISQASTQARTYDDIEDFGKSLQSEILIASEVADGYVRELEVPSKINGQQYNITIYDSAKFTYMIIEYRGQERFYPIPPLNGTFHSPKTYLHKNGTLYLT